MWDVGVVSYSTTIGGAIQVARRLDQVEVAIA